MRTSVTLGGAIRARRTRLGLSQRTVAEAAGIDRAHLTRIEGGRWEPRISTLDRIAGALQTTSEHLMRGSSRAA